MDTTVDSNERLRILIANDDFTTRSLLWDILEFMGHQVAFATSGEVATERLASGSFQVLFLEPTLPDLSGWEVLRLARERHPDLCVILLTNSDTEMSSSEAARLGADGCVQSVSCQGGVGAGENSLDNLRDILWRSLERRRLAVANERLQRELDSRRDEAERARKMLELAREQLLEGQRNKAMLETASSASSDLIQPLKVLIGRIDLLIQESVPDAQLLEEMLKLRQQAVRMSPIVHRMGQFTRGALAPDPVRTAFQGDMEYQRNWG